MDVNKEAMFYAFTHPLSRDLRILLYPILNLNKRLLDTAVKDELINLNCLTTSIIPRVSGATVHVSFSVR